jgi:hypothetical protein
MAAPSSLYRSSITIDSISRSFGSLSQGLNNSRKTIAKINKNISGNNESKRKSLTRNSLLFQRKRENIRRKKQRSLLDLSRLGSVFAAPRAAISNTGKSLLGRMMDFAGTIMAGWLVYNLPTISAMANELGARVVRLTQILGEFLPSTGRILTGLGDVIGSYTTNILSFDFFDNSKRVEKSMDALNSEFLKMHNSFNEAIALITTPLTEGLDGRPSAPPFGTEYPQGPSVLPAQDSPEMYRIAAALTTEGSGQQSTVDMMQVVVNRKAEGYGKTFTDVLAASGQFAGVEKRGTSSFRKIQTLDDASRWSGQSKDTLLKVIKWLQDPTLQQKAASFVGGALEFRGSPATVRAVNSDSDPNNNIQADSRGIIPGSVWRGGNGDNQFITSNPPGASKVPIRQKGPASFNLPAPIPPAKTTPSKGTMELIPQTGPGGFIQGKTGKGTGTHFHIDNKTGNYTPEVLANIREVAFRAIKAMQARGSIVFLTNYSQQTPASKNDSILRSQILQDQQIHGRRSTPGIDIQEQNPNVSSTYPGWPGSATKFPYAVGEVKWNGGYGYEAEIIGSGGITVSHGAEGSTASQVPQQVSSTNLSSTQIASATKPLNTAIAAAPERKRSTIIVMPQEQQPQIIPSSSGTFSSPSVAQAPINNNRNIFLTDLAYT